MISLTRQAVILVGGRGTRLGSITDNIPKPLLLLNKKPFLTYIVENLLRFGINDIILLAGYHGDKIQDFANDFNRNVGNKIVRCVIEKQAMGTGGALLQIYAYLDDQFFLLNGDSFFDINLIDLTNVAKNKKWVGKIALREVPNISRFGAISLQGDKILSFGEKNQSGHGLINGGIYLLKRTLIKCIQNTPSSLESEIFPNLIKSGQLYGKSY